ncbi:DUF3883 domain-containing protein [Candidatus Dojkabacteria bacterium]|jgi:hypothetical protein|uniref:DUF3883 domain-containing protein n=1 Tax=Candidatus Dojkabacteria bacterium TaxID=2099670 RepID=A0A5C7J4G5_9BACT|nr:MAG: DUF3883 domain-containing protein [Candidatus Dojkabacteria bacterium]
MKEPKLEEFGLSSTLYSEYFSKKRSLEKIKEDSEQSLKAINDSPIHGLLGFILFVGIYGMIPFGVFISSYVGNVAAWVISLGIAWGVIFLLERNLIENIISFGKYNEFRENLSKTKEGLDKLKTDFEAKVSSFEETFYGYYESLLENFYATRLYKKRSGTEEFAESIAEFSSILSSLDDSNKVLVTRHFKLFEYKQYLSSRISGHNFQKNRELNKDFLPLADFIKKTEPKHLIEKETLPPEVTYRVPRKIDWDEITKGRRLTGITGEEIVLAIEKDYLCSLGREDLAEKILHTAKERGDGAGYDISSFFSDGRKKYIEVKATKNSLDSAYYISRNELGFLRDNPETSFVYRVLISENSPEEHHLEALTAEDILQESEIIPVNYLVKKK